MNLDRMNRDLIGEKAAEMIAADHDVKISEFVGERSG